MSSRSDQTLPYDCNLNEPIRVYPPNPSHNGRLSAMLSLQKKNVAVVGILSTSSSSCSSAFTFANRIIGRYAFKDDDMLSAMTVNDTRLPATIHLYYDDVARCIYLLGVAVPDSLCYNSHGMIITKAELPSKNSKHKSSVRRQPTIEKEAEDLPELSWAQRIRNVVDNCTREKLKMQVLLYSSCNMLIVLKESARVTTNALKEIRALAVEKHLLQSFLPTSTKHSKRDSNHSKSTSTSSSIGGNGFAPGRCVPMVVYAVPAPINMSQQTHSSRSAMMSYCKSLEARLTTLFRSLRGNTVGMLRTRDALSASNLNKERRLFHFDSAHCVVVVSRRTTTRREVLLDNLLAAIDSNVSAVDVLNNNSLLQPLMDDNMGLQCLDQYVQRYLGLLFSYSPSGTKDGGRTELLNPSQWLKAFHGLFSSYSRLDSNRRKYVVVHETEAKDVTSDHFSTVSQATYPTDLIEPS